MSDAFQSDAFQFDFGTLSRRLFEVQAAVGNMQRDLGSVEAKGFAGGGVVTAVVTGEGRLADLQIDPSVIEPADPESLAALVVAAVNSALDDLAGRRTEMMSGITDGLAGITDGVRRPDSGVRPLRPNRP